MNPGHSTPLKSHLKTSRLWLDLFLLTLLWALSWQLPQHLTIFQKSIWGSLLKIITLISTLEVIGFFSFHLLGRRAGVLIQGFIGGFISSTMVFLQFTQHEEFKTHTPLTIARALLLSSVAMMLPSIFIILSIDIEHPLDLMTPLIVQIVVISLFLIYFSLISHRSTSHHKIMVIDRPITWKKVFYFALLMIGLIYGMRFLNDFLSLSPLISAFAISLFEAHGVLAATIADRQNEISTTIAVEIVMIISLGNVISKTFFILRGKNPALRIPVLLPLFIAVLAAGLTFLI